MSRLRVRLAGPSDLEVLVHQRHMMFEDMRHPTPEQQARADDAYRRWAPKMMKRGLLRCYLVVRGKDVVGGGSLWLRDVQPGPGQSVSRIPYLLSMYTEPPFRRRGVATMVVKEAMRWARDHGYPKATLHASSVGRKVYSKLGWERTWEMAVDL